MRRRRLAGKQRRRQERNRARDKGRSPTRDATRNGTGDGTGPRCGNDTGRGRGLVAGIRQLGAERNRLPKATGRRALDAHVDGTDTHAGLHIRRAEIAGMACAKKAAAIPVMDSYNTSGGGAVNYDKLHLVGGRSFQFHRQHRVQLTGDAPHRHDDELKSSTAHD